jgi:hypothetical protein
MRAFMHVAMTEMRTGTSWAKIKGAKSHPAVACLRVGTHYCLGHLWHEKSGISNAVKKAIAEFGIKGYTGAMESFEKFWAGGFCPTTDRQLQWTEKVLKGMNKEVCKKIFLEQAQFTRGVASTVSQDQLECVSWSVGLRLPNNTDFSSFTGKAQFFRCLNEGEWSLPIMDQLFTGKQHYMWLYNLSVQLKGRNILTDQQEKMLTEALKADDPMAIITTARNIGIATAGNPDVPNMDIPGS